jgi:hypothetical protein
MRKSLSSKLTWHAKHGPAKEIVKAVDEEWISEKYDEDIEKKQAEL